jgi:copper chaperone
MVLQLQVPSMVCDGCANTVTQAIHAVDNTANVAVDLTSKSVSVDTNATDGTAIVAAIIATGHTVES